MLRPTRRIAALARLVTPPRRFLTHGPHPPAASDDPHRASPETDPGSQPASGCSGTGTTSAGAGVASPLHGVKHQLEHRAIEKTGLGFLAAVFRRITGGIGERAAERAAERGVERAGKRAAEHAGERIAERARERLAERAGDRVIVEAGGRALALSGLGGRLLLRAARGLPVLIPVLGGVFALLLVRADLRRRAEERLRVGASGAASAAFGLAAALDGVDAVAHALIVGGSMFVLPGGHDFVAAGEWASVGAALLGTGAALGAELLAAQTAGKQGGDAPAG